MNWLFKPEHDVSYTFKISRVADGSFKNLWQLEFKGPKDEVFSEVVDADSLSICIDKIAYIFETDGL
jgi:hypothetical protein